MRPRHAALALLLLGIVLALAWLAFRPAAQTPQPPPLPEPSPVAEAPLPAPAPDLILDLFEPTPDMLDAQQRATHLRGEIEQALTLTFLLTRCHYLTRAEYSSTYADLVHYAARSGLSADLTAAEAELQRIAASAGASYALVYSRVPCDDDALPQTAATLRAWRAQFARTVSDSSSNP